MLRFAIKKWYARKCDLASLYRSYSKELHLSQAGVYIPKQATLRKMSKRPADNSEKLRKKFLQEQQKRIKPGECLKYIRVVVDEDILRPNIGGMLLSALTEATTNHIIRKHKCPQVITWERNVGQQIFAQSEDNQLYDLNEKFEQEQLLLRVFSVKDLQSSIENKTIHDIIRSIKVNYPGMQITLVAVGMLPKCNNQFERETSLVELQILYECSIHIVNNQSELAQTVIRFTKAVSEIPYKKQKSALFSTSSQFLLNDNKDCVRVDGSNGLGRLWQQHLNRLPLVTLDVAQTILNEYPCPKMLLKEFQSNPAGPSSLADLKVSRGAILLANERRIGDVLSKKLYTLYTSTDPSQIL